MKTLIHLFFGGLLFLSVNAASVDPIREALQRGLLAEEAENDLKAAVVAYTDALQLVEERRNVTATILFRLAEAQRRLGQTNEAAANYQRLLREYAEHTNLTTLALIQVAPSRQGAASASSEVAEPAELLKQEIALVKQQLVYLQQRLQSGLVGPEEVLKLERELFGLKRQLAGEKPKPAGKVILYGEIQAEIPLFSGEVKRMSDAIIASGRSQFADLRRVRLHRLNSSTATNVVIILNVDKMLREGDRTDDMELQPGDRIETRPRTLNF